MDRSARILTLRRFLPPEAIAAVLGLDMSDVVSVEKDVAAALPAQPFDSVLGFKSVAAPVDRIATVYGPPDNKGLLTFKLNDRRLVRVHARTEIRKGAGGSSTGSVDLMIDGSPAVTLTGGFDFGHGVLQSANFSVMYADVEGFTAGTSSAPFTQGQVGPGIDYIMEAGTHTLELHSKVITADTPVTLRNRMLMALDLGGIPAS